MSLWRAASWPSSLSLCVLQCLCWPQASDTHTQCLLNTHTEPAGTYSECNSTYSEFSQHFTPPTHCAFLFSQNSGFLQKSSLQVLAVSLSPLFPAASHFLIYNQQQLSFNRKAWKHHQNLYVFIHKLAITLVMLVPVPLCWHKKVRNSTQDFICPSLLQRWKPISYCWFKLTAHTFQRCYILKRIAIRF